MRKMRLDDIKISSAFAETTPNEKKMEECRFNWRWYGKQDRYIVVDHNNVLIDGYVQYLILKEHKEEYADVKISHCRKKRWYRKNTRDWTIPHYRNEPTTYIYGVHPNSNCKKTFMWRVPESWNGWVDNVQIGDTILCQTKHGYSPIIVTKMETLDKCPVELGVNKVAKREIRRNGCIV